MMSKKIVDVSVCVPLHIVFKQEEMNMARIQVALLHAAQFAFDGFKESLQGRTHALGDMGRVQAAAASQPGKEIFSDSDINFGFRFTGLPEDAEQ